MPDQQSYTDNLHLRSEEVHEIISTPPAWLIRWGITLVFVITSGIVFLSFYIHYPDFVHARVIVTTLEPTERVMARSSGQIERFFVKNGENVIVEQQLASIKSTARLDDIQSLKATLDRIPFGKGIRFEFPIDSVSNLQLGEIEMAYMDFERSYMEFKLLESLQPYVTQLEGNRKSWEEVHDRLNHQVLQKELLERKVKLVEVDFERNKVLFEEGVISAKDFESKELEYLQTQEQVNTMAISISQLQEALAQAGQTMRSTHISKEQDETRALMSLIQSYYGLKRAIREWEHTYVMTASVQGVVSYQGIWGINQFVDAGQHVFSVLPNSRSDLLGKMQVPAQSVGKIEAGQRVLIKLDNFPYQQFGTLRGEVVSLSVSPDAEGSYVIYVSLPDGMETSYDRELSLTQELLGTAEIITEDMSIAERLFFKFKSITTY